MQDKIKLLEKEKARLSEKWIRVSARAKAEEKGKTRVKELEILRENAERELDVVKVERDALRRESETLRCALEQEHRNAVAL